MLQAREAEKQRQAAEAHAAAQARLEARVAAGFDPSDSLIEKLRQRLDLDATLRAHGYAVSGGKYRHPDSHSGSYGADVKTFGGIQRVYSHNAGDPLHRDNLPAWCDGVTALDVMDVVTILEFGGDRSRALRELAQRFGLNCKDECRETRRLAFQLLRMGLPGADVLATLHEQNKQRPDPLPSDAIRTTAIYCLRKMKEQRDVV